mgnify:CR=1 FL=1
MLLALTNGFILFNNWLRPFLWIVMESRDYLTHCMVKYNYKEWFDSSGVMLRTYPIIACASIIDTFCILETINNTLSNKIKWSYMLILVYIKNMFYLNTMWLILCSCGVLSLDLNIMSLIVCMYQTRYALMPIF